MVDINLNESHILNILKALRTEFISAKAYYEEHKEEDERIGVISPEEWQDTYNEVLSQAHSQNILTLLEVIK